MTSKWQDAGEAERRNYTDAEVSAIIRTCCSPEEARNWFSAAYLRSTYKFDAVVHRNSVPQETISALKALEDEFESNDQVIHEDNGISLYDRLDSGTLYTPLISEMVSGPLEEFAAIVRLKIRESTLNTNLKMAAGREASLKHWSSCLTTLKDFKDRLRPGSHTIPEI